MRATFRGSCSKAQFGQFRRSSFGPIALQLAIELSAVFVSFKTGGSPSDRVTGFGNRPSIIVRLRAAEVVLSKEATARLHLARFSSSFRRSFPSSSLMYCALPTFLPCKFHPPLRCSYQPLMSPTLANSSSLQAYTCRYLSSVACMTSLNFLHVFHHAQKAEPPAKAPRTAVRAFYLFVQACSNLESITLFSADPDTRPCRIGLVSSPLRTVCMVCMVITYSSVWINRVRLPILLVVS